MQTQYTRTSFHPKAPPMYARDRPALKRYYHDKQCSVLHKTPSPTPDHPHPPPSIQAASRFPKSPAPTDYPRPLLSTQSAPCLPPCLTSLTRDANHPTASVDTTAGPAHTSRRRLQLVAECRSGCEARSQQPGGHCVRVGSSLHVHRMTGRKLEPPPGVLLELVYLHADGYMLRGLRGIHYALWACGDRGWDRVLRRCGWRGYSVKCVNFCRILVRWCSCHRCRTGHAVLAMMGLVVR